MSNNSVTSRERTPLEILERRLRGHARRVRTCIGDNPTERIGSALVSVSADVEKAADIIATLARTFSWADVDELDAAISYLEKGAPGSETELRGICRRIAAVVAADTP